MFFHILWPSHRFLWTILWVSLRFSKSFVRPWLLILKPSGIRECPNLKAAVANSLKIPGSTVYILGQWVLRTCCLLCWTGCLFVCNRGDTMHYWTWTNYGALLHSSMSMMDTTTQYHSRHSIKGVMSSLESLADSSQAPCYWCS